MIGINLEVLVIVCVSSLLLVVDLLIDLKINSSVVVVMLFVTGVVLSISELSVLPVENVVQCVPGISRYYCMKYYYVCSR